MPLVSKTFSQIITFTRASSATFFDQTGVLQTATTDVPRLDYNPSTLAALGLLIEESRTNSIRNNTMVGAAAGTPGTLPTNWAVSGLGTLTQTVVGTGTANGINYIDIRFNGTTSTTQVSIRFESTNGAAGTNGQTFTFSSWVARVAGSTSNIGDISASANVFDSGFVFLSSISFTGYPVTAPTTLARASGTGTIASASAAFIQPQIYINFTSGVAIDITLRIGLPQLEQGAFATSVIPTTTTAVTRAADVASVNTLSPWYNASAGTLYAEGTLVGGTAGTFPRMTTLAGSNPNNDDIGVVWPAASGQMRWAVRAGGTGQADINAAPSKTAGALFKVAGRYAVNNFQMASDGNLGTADTSGSLPTITALLLGGPASFQPSANIWLRRVTFYPRGLTDAELQTLTT